jgi:hypothetical protein
LLQQAVNQRGLAVIDMSNDGNVAKRFHGGFRSLAFISA